MSTMEASTTNASRTERLKASPPMFENRWLDKLSRVHPVTPLVIYVPVIALLFTGLFVVVVGSPTWMPFEAGFLGGYLAYDMLHYYVHHHRPRSRIGKRLRSLHMRHHFQDDTTGYGVSAPWWDHVFGTATRASRRPGE